MIYQEQLQSLLYIYILLCNDGSYYTGLTNDLERRFKEHCNGTYRFCYTFNRRPLQLVYFETIPFLQEAIEREQQLKRWSRAKKTFLIKRDYHRLQLLSQCMNLSHHKYQNLRQQKSSI